MSVVTIILILLAVFALRLAVEQFARRRGALVGFTSVGIGLASIANALPAHMLWG
jgi:hypothetical protein